MTLYRVFAVPSNPRKAKYRQRLVGVYASEERRDARVKQEQERCGAKETVKWVEVPDSEPPARPAPWPAAQKPHTSWPAVGATEYDPITHLPDEPLMPIKPLVDPALIDREEELS